MQQPATELWVASFDDPYKAGEARALFYRMSGEGLLELEESAVVVVGLDGKTTISQDDDVAGHRRKQGHIIGLIAAAVTGVTPLIMVGTLSGAVIGRLTDHGITTHMMKTIGESLTPGTSALFLLGRTGSDAEREKVIERIRHFRPSIVQTSVAPELRQQIEALLLQTESSRE